MVKEKSYKNFDFPDADAFSFGEQPANLTLKDVERLGEVEPMLAEQEEVDEFKERLESKSIKTGDYVGFRSNDPYHLGWLDRNNLDNVFEVTNVESREHGQVMIEVRNKKKPNVGIKLRAYFFKKLNS